MQLRYSPTSPYVRKVVASAIELGLNDQIERIPTNPWDTSTDLPARNPIGKVPALITDDNWVLFDSPVICEYLDSLGGAPNLFPEAGRDRWAALRHQALADGILDASVLRLLEGRRPTELQSQDWVERQRNSVRRCLNVLEAEVETLPDALTIAHISIGCALGYVDFRFASETWRNGRPRLSAWYERIAQRESFQESVPRE